MANWSQANDDIQRARRDFWFFAKHLETRDQIKKIVRPFPKPQDYPYLGDLVENELKHLWNITLKSRQVFCSNLYCGMFLWEMWRADVNEAGTDIPQVFGGFQISKRLDDAKELHNRTEFMYYSLPEHFREWNPVASKNKSEIILQRGGEIVSLPSGEDIGRTFTITWLLFDEAAFHKQGRAAWTALVPTIGDEGKASVISTPNGKDNMFYDLWSEDHNFCKNTIHWSQHPERDEAWAKKTRKGYIKQEDWDREQELSFEISAGPRMYPGFSRKINVVNFAKNEIKPLPNKPIIRSWDYGFVHPAVTWWQCSEVDQVRVFAEMMGTEIDLFSFAAEVKAFSEAKFGPDVRYIEVDDPWAANQRSPSTSNKDHQTQRKILNGLGIYPNSKVEPLSAMQDKIRKLIKMRSDGQPGLIIDEDCSCWVRRALDKPLKKEAVLIDGFLGGYARKTLKTPSGEIYIDEALKDGWYEHCMNALEFSISYFYNTMLEPQGEDTKPPDFGIGVYGG